MKYIVIKKGIKYKHNKNIYILFEIYSLDGFVPDCGNSIANTPELPQFCY